LIKVFTPELVDAAVAGHRRGELRRRLLPAPADQRLEGGHPGIAVASAAAPVRPGLARILKQPMRWPFL